MYIVEFEWDGNIKFDGDNVFVEIKIRFLGDVVVIVWDNFMYELVEDVLRKYVVVVYNFIFVDDLVGENINNENLWFWWWFYFD